MNKPIRVVLLTVLSVAVLGILLWFGDAAKVLALIYQFRPIYLLWFVLLLIALEALRGLLWHVLVQALCDGAPPRAEIAAFAAGEGAKFVPTGVYLQNYLLQRLAGIDFGRSSAATTVMIGGEIAVALIGVIILGIELWSPLLLLIVAIGALVALLLVRPTQAIGMPAWVRRRRLLRRAYDAYRGFRAGTAILARADIVAITLVLSALYVFVAGADLYMVVRGLGVTGISFWQVEAVSCFGLAFYLVLGSLEAADLGAFISLGVSKSAAVSAILLNRGLSVGVTMLLSAITMALLRDQWRGLRGRRPSGSVPAAGEAGIAAHGQSVPDAE